MLKLSRKYNSLTAILLLFVNLCGMPANAQAPDTRKQPDAWKEELVKNVNAPVKVIEFFDYQCPYCAATIPALDEALRSYPGKVQLVLRNMPLSIHPDSMLAHQAALAAAEQGKFWEMHALLFANRSRLKPENLLDYARQLKLDIARFQQRLQSGYYKAAVEKDIALANSLAIHATPTFLINGQKLVGAQSAERLKWAIDAALDPRNAGEALPPLEPTKAILKKLDFSHSPVRGNKDAPITIIEFSDMQCPFCAAVTPTLRQLMTQYPNKIKWVFKNFPLEFHADSPLAHRAVLAAGQQGKFWEMHDLIFADQNAIKPSDLLQKAQRLDLDITRFKADLDSDKIKEMVEADLKEGAQLDVGGTPTFFINGNEYSGAMSLFQFQEIIGKEMPLEIPVHAATDSANGRDEISIGAADAPVTLTWYSDLQSDLTVKATLQVRQLMSTYSGKIRVVFKNRPLETHPGAMKLHEAALAANAQDKFWQMHDLIIANPHKDDKQTLLGYASRLGLDLKRFESELDKSTYRAAVESDLEEARARGVFGTPVFFVNATRIDGLQPQKQMEQVITEQLTARVQANSSKP